MFSFITCILIVFFNRKFQLIFLCYFLFLLLINAFFLLFHGTNFFLFLFLFFFFYLYYSISFSLFFLLSLTLSFFSSPSYFSNFLRFFFLSKSSHTSFTLLQFSFLKFILIYPYTAKETLVQLARQKYFSSASLPLATTRCVRSTLLILYCPFTTSAVNDPWHQYLLWKMLWERGIRSWDHWGWSKNAPPSLKLLCQPKEILIIQSKYSPHMTCSLLKRTFQWKSSK